ncbi:hypothetical protein [Thermococcus henrietii]|uniref:hypothetical protein n=1 Tax=Thermococcus henrietii TaxID=2016361 RepID=UPI000C06B1CE|nr:hypothetical protein [Thermococcus henrietii]
MPVLPRGKLYVDGQDIATIQNTNTQPQSAPTTTASQASQSSQTTSSGENETRAPPRGVIYVDGEWDAAAGPPPTSPPNTNQGRQTALSLLVKEGDAKEINTPSNWLHVQESNQRNPNSHPKVTVDPNTVTEGTFDAYHPSTGEKVRRWFDQNVDKIPVVNFFHLIHEQAQTAKKETMIELAEKGETGWKARLIGVEYGILVDSLVDAPGTIYDALKSAWDSIPANTQGPTGLTHKQQKVKIITGDPDKEITNNLIMAGAAPKTYRAEQKLKQAQKLQPEIIKLNEQAEQLKEQAKWFEENRQRAENDPFFARIYNAEAQEFNQQVIEYNQKVLSVEMQLKALGVDEANEQVEKFNKNLENVNKNFAIGEIAGGLVASAVLAEAIAPTVRAVAPEKVVRTETSFPDIFGNTAGTRSTVKETVYKGWLRKKPVETRYSTTLEVEGDMRYMKSFINGPEGVALRIGGKDTRQFVLNKFLSMEPLKAEPAPTPSAQIGPEEFEKITGKPWPAGVAKKELETQMILRTTDGREITLIELENKNLVIGKTTFRKGQLRPEFSLSAKEKVLTPEDISLMQKITNAKAVRVGDKYLKAARSGNVFSTFYDPPTSPELIEQSRLRIVPDTGTFRVHPMDVQMEEGVLLAVPGAPTWVGEVEKERGLSVKGQLQLIKKLDVKVLEEKKLRFTEKPDETHVRYQSEYDIIKIKQDLMRRFLTKTGEGTRRTTKFYPDDIPTPHPQEAVRVEITAPQIQTQPPLELQTQKPKPYNIPLTTTLDFPKPDKPRVFVPGYIRLPTGGSLFSMGKAFGRDSWMRKLAFFKNPFGGTSKSNPFSFSLRKKRGKKHKGRRKARKGRGGGKRAKKR